MSTITKEFTKEQLISEARANIETMAATLSKGITDSPRRLARNLRLNEIALASLEAEPVASCIIEDGHMCVDGFCEYVDHSLPDGTFQLYTAPPAPRKL